ncbi:SRSO17 transposase [Haloechinothrix alba]|uniref:SRSO17 transposase n=1 Tax=Haloechinothrix alba TaxID=664784 RepID=A0A239AZ28_9PSEU|nr:IS701 family transposase [Haloechinothrix alba]SNS00193.1 SRSO17 transposase [Haloechinothrix alba]
MGDDVCVAEVQEWADGLAELDALIGPRFARAEPRARAMHYVRGLLSGEERKNSWTLSEQVGDATPDGMQRLLSTTDWDPEAVRDDLYGYVIDNLGDPAGVLVLDETGFLKKGTRSVGVQRQYSGTAGRIENCQIGVFLAYATDAGRTLLDRELYLPQGWINDRGRCADAGIPDEVGFATKPDLAIGMLRRAHAAGVPAGWVTADEVYGQHFGLRSAVEELGMSYVLAVPCNQHVLAADPTLTGQYRADELITALPAQAWRTRSPDNGAKGQRRYAWARTRVRGINHPDSSYWLLARRSLSDPGDIAYYLCHAPARTTLAELVRVTGSQWAVEETFRTAKGETGLDQYQVRQWSGWYRHITLSMLAHAFLTVTRSKKGGIPSTTQSATASSSP